MLSRSLAIVLSRSRLACRRAEEAASYAAIVVRERGMVEARTTDVLAVRDGGDNP